MSSLLKHCCYCFSFNTEVAKCFTALLFSTLTAAFNDWSNFLLKCHNRNTERLLTHTGPLSEGHEGAEDAMNHLRTMLDREASLQL